MTLTKEQRKIVRTIQQLHRRGEPLNITAVKRLHPELMKAVYAVKPFWGWKRALEAAGIKPGDYPIALQDYVTCALCGAEVISLSLHLNNTHQVSMADYRTDYPDDPLVAESSLARRWPMPPVAMPHWEKVWSPEYVLDRIAAYAEAGQLPHTDWACRNEQRLLLNACRFFGGWKQALTAIGLDPRHIRREVRRLSTRYPDGNSVVRELKRRDRSGLLINRLSLIKGPLMDSALVESGIKFFGSWPRALAAAGFDARTVRRAFCRKHRRYPDAKSVIRTVRRRYRKGLPVFQYDMGSTKYHDQPLQRAAIEYFGSCRKMLATAGIKPVVLRRMMGIRRRRYPDAASVLREIRRRIESHLPVSSIAVTRAPNADHALRNSVLRHFGSWANLIRRVGLTPQTVPEAFPRQQPRRYKTPDAVLAEIRRRSNLRGRGLLSKDVQRGPHLDMALFHSALKFFHDWYAAVAAAGLNTKALKAGRWRSMTAYPAPADVLNAIRRRSAKGLPLNTRAVTTGRHRDMSLYHSARKFFGSYGKAVCAAGLNYAAIRLRRAPERRPSSRQGKCEMRGHLVKRRRVIHEK